MAKIVTAHLLINSDDEGQIEAFMNEILSKLSTAPRGMIIDSIVLGETAMPSKAVQDALQAGNYTEGLAFDHENGQMPYLLIMKGDVNPVIQGPCESDDLRLEAARRYRKSNGDSDGLYRLDVPRGIEVQVGPLMASELDGPSGEDPVAIYAIQELEAARAITNTRKRLKQPSKRSC